MKHLACYNKEQTMLMKSPLERHWIERLSVCAILDVQKAKYVLFSVECLMSVINYKSLSFFPGTFHFAQGFVFGRFLSEKNDTG